MRRKNRFYRDQISLPDVASLNEKQLNTAVTELRGIGKLGKARRLQKRWLRHQHRAALGLS